MCLYTRLIICLLTVCVKCINFVFQIILSLLFFLTFPKIICITLFRLSLLIWITFFNNFSIACFLWSSNFEDSSSSNSSCSLKSYLPHLSLAEFWLDSLLSFFFSLSFFLSKFALLLNLTVSDDVNSPLLPFTFSYLLWET